MTIRDLKEEIEDVIYASVSPIHYNQVPDYCFIDGGSILDVGCMSGLNALLSRHRQHFLAAETRNDFLGVDILKYPKQYFSPIVTADILDIDLDDQYDLVLALHIVEHIHYQKWPQLFAKLRALVAPDGHLVVATPYDEEVPQEGHLVIHIKKDILLDFLPGGHAYTPKRRYLTFRESHESLVWAVGRFFWRILTRHPYRWRLRNCELVVIWKNDGT